MKKTYFYVDAYGHKCLPVYRDEHDNWVVKVPSVGVMPITSEAFEGEGKPDGMLPMPVKAPKMRIEATFNPCRWDRWDIAGTIIGLCIGSFLGSLLGQLTWPLVSGLLK